MFISRLLKKAGLFDGLFRTFLALSGIQVKPEMGRALRWAALLRSIFWGCIAVCWFRTAQTAWNRVAFAHILTKRQSLPPAIQGGAVFLGG